MIPEIAKDGIVKRKLAGETWTAIAKWVEQEFGEAVHRTTVQRWYDKEVFLENLNPDDVVLDDIEDRIKIDKKLATSKAEAAFYKKLYTKSLREYAQTDLLSDIIKGSVPGFNKVEVYAKKNKVSSETPQAVVAPLTDTHIGEFIDLEQMVGLNSYDFDIFNQRLYGWATQLVTLVEFRRNAVPIPELVVPMLGDMISGDIHEELSNTNLTNCMMQMIRGANLIAQALMFVAPHFETIRVPCVVGNHGRMTRKPPMKDKYMDWDYLMYQWIAALCKNQPNIEFHIPRSFITVFSVCNRNILAMHGDAVSGAGSLASITKVLTNLRSVLHFKKGLENELGEVPEGIPAHFDSVMIGHFHRVDELDIGTGSAHICGCMKGADEFAMNRLQAVTKPQQIVTYWHPQYGYIGKEIIYLNRYDNTKSKFKDEIPEIWVNNGYN
mgnify:FL=1